MTVHSRLHSQPHSPDGSMFKVGASARLRQELLTCY